ncbi:MAG: penicillin-binding protein, partial [Acidimicrobiia bacterium]|nr:penicillin-binding protein [Acidimicrobiia bacterium]
MRIVFRTLFGFVQLVAILLLGGTALAFTAAAVSPSLADIWSAKTTSAADVDLTILETTTTVYDKNGQLIAELRAEIDREYISLDQMSDQVKETVLAVEDANFYTHGGVNVTAIVRAGVTNLSAGGIEQGGSTITQQLVKLGVVGDEQVLERKLPEAAIAMRLEDKMTKDEILERYMNAAYFGGGAYGVQSAAELYFNKDARFLTYGESALLAGLISNPSLYDPVYRPTNAANRRNTALGRLVAEGFITQEEREELAAAPIPRYRQLEGEAFLDTYFVEEVRRSLLDDVRLGATPTDRFNTVYYGGLEVYTTFDPVAQSFAENAMNAELPENRLTIIGALLSMEPNSGAIRAMIGGPGFEKFEFNVSTQKGRPTGSSFKPFVLAAAFEQRGIVPSDQVLSTSPCEFENPNGFPNPYEAGDYGDARRTGTMTVQEHTLRSTNCGFLRLGQIAGLNNVVDTARAMGLRESNIEAVISLPLGPYDVTPLEMATAYGTLANEGISVQPYMIDRVTQRGDTLIQHVPQRSRAISTQTARLVTDILEKNISCAAGRCTGRRARIEGRQAAGKTGTGQNNYDAWFVGYTPQVVTAVWIGGQDGQIRMKYDRNSEDYTRQDYINAFGEFADAGVTGGSIPAAIWGRFMNDFMVPLPVETFNEPDRTRSGKKLALVGETLDSVIVRVSPCGSEEAEVD